MIKAIIFDRHGVFDKVTTESIVKTMLQYTTYETYDSIQNKLQDPRSQYDLGILKPTNFRSIVQETFDFTEKQTQECINHLLTVQPVEGLRDIVPSLKKSYTLGILSDCPEDKKEAILKQYNNLKQFPYQFRSCDYVKTKEQGSEFFEMMYMYLHQNDIVEKHEQILFVDDTLTNVHQAQELGMMGCHFHNINDLKKFIHRE